MATRIPSSSPSAPSGSRPRDRLLRLLPWLAAAAALGLLAVLAYQAMFSSLPSQDDDGYVIVSLRNFLAGGDLYGDVYSQYGPGLFVFVGGLMDILGVPLTTDGARWVNLVLWLASTALTGLILLRISRNAAIAAAGALVAFILLGVDANEPLHPGAVLGFLLLAMVLAATNLEARPRPNMALVGACAAALLTIKVNVGALALVSLAFTAVFTAPALRRIPALPALAGVAFAALPFALLEAHLGDADTFRFALITACSGAGLALIAMAVPPDPRLPLDRWAWFAGGAGAVLAVAVGGVVISGTSPGELVEGWFADPSRTPDLQYVAVPWFGPAGWEVIGLIAAVVTAVCMSRGVQLEPRWRAVVGLARMVIGLAVWLVLCDPITDVTFGFPLGLDYAAAIGTPFAWLIVAVPSDRLTVARFLRVLIAALAILQILHGYPVPGSQFGWGQLLLVIVGGLCIADGVADLGPARVAGTVAIVAFAAWLLFAPLHRYDDAVESRYDEFVTLDLPGAERTRAPQAVVDQLHSVVGEIDARCDSFITLPGLNSLYLWTERDAPTVLSGPWPFFFTASDQQNLVDRFAGDTSLCVVEREDALRFWAGFSGGKVPQLPLVDFIEKEFAPVYEQDGYTLGVRR